MNYLPIVAYCDLFPCLLSGILSLLFGSLIAIVEILYPHKFSTILLVDYDTPYNYFVAHKDTQEVDSTGFRKSYKFGQDNRAFEQSLERGTDAKLVSSNPSAGIVGTGDRTAAVHGTAERKQKRQHVVGWKQSLTDVAGEEKNVVADDGKGIRHPRLTRYVLHFRLGLAWSVGKPRNICRTFFQIRVSSIA